MGQQRKWVYGSARSVSEAIRMLREEGCQVVVDEVDGRGTPLQLPYCHVYCANQAIADQVVANCSIARIVDPAEGYPRVFIRLPESGVLEGLTRAGLA